MTVRIITGDCREVLKTLPDDSVHCVVSSPPYFGLRDYGTAKWEGGDEGCDHAKVSDAIAAVATSTLGGGKKSTGHLQEGFKSVCGKCGARRIDSQIGLEPTPDAFVAEMVAVFREVRRVLRGDGTLWLNLGDSYAGARGGSQGAFGQCANRSAAAQNVRVRNADRLSPGLKSKDLIGIPWRVAFALQADGWWLRQDIIWSKPNPMPESVTDRCTKAHEYMFMLTKAGTYWYDAEAVEEPTSDNPITRARNGRADKGKVGASALWGTGYGQSGQGGHDRAEPATRNRRSVWTVATAPFSEAHFATFPPGLIEPCIKAGCPEGGTVLDPFGGAGTTGLVADRLGRNAILIELNPEYAAMAEKRIKADAGLFAEVAA